MIEPTTKDKKETLFLIVDDDFKTIKKIKDILRIYGYKKFVDANDGTTAWNNLKRFEVDFVICNYQLKSMNGLALLKLMMADEMFCSIPFLMMSLRADKFEVIESAKAGVSGFFIKPFNNEKFIFKVEQIINTEIDSTTKEIKKLFSQAKQYTNEGMLEKALELYNTILSLQEDSEAFYHIGYIKEAQGNYEEAAAAFRRAIQFNTTFVKAYEALGNTYKKLGEPEKSENFFEKAGDLYLKKEMLEEAEEVYKSANTLNPNNLNIYNSLGILYRRKGLYPQAIKEYKKALTVEPDDEHIHYNLGRALLEDKQIEPAKKHFETALAINPSFAEALQMLKAISLGFTK